MSFDKKKYQAEWMRQWRAKHPELAKAKYLRSNKKRSEAGKFRAHYLKNKTRYAENGRRRAQGIKLEVINNYGGKCACCGESNLIFLAIDHIDGGGRKHLESLGINAGCIFHRWLKKNNFPQGFQVLCHNCNFAKSNGGCPHQLELKIINEL
jgi:hypothetical protein